MEVVLQDLMITIDQAARQQQLQDIATGNAKLLNAGMLGRIITREDDVKNKMTSYGLADTLKPRSASETDLIGRSELTNPIDIFGSLQ